MQRIATALLIALVATGCATQMVEQSATDRCAKQGKKAFITDVEHSGIPLIIDSASAMVLCVGSDDLTHLPQNFGADVVSASNLGGVGVFGIVPGLVADKAGIRPNDVVTEFAGTAVGRAPELAQAIERTSRGDSVAVKLRRKGKAVTVTAQF